MATALFTDAELLCFDHDIITIIRKIKNQHQRTDSQNSIHKKTITIPDYHNVSKKFLNIWVENLLQNGRIRNKPNRGNPSFTLNDVTTEIPIHDSCSISDVETPSTEYNLQTPNNSPIAFTIPETQELITNMVNDFSFTEVKSPEDALQVYPVSEHNVSHLQLSTVLENELFLDNMEKEIQFVNFKNNINSDLTKIISEKIKPELKTFKIESSKHL